MYAFTDSSLHQEVRLVPFIEEKMETSTVSTKRQYFMETSSSMQVKSTISSSGDAPQVEIHSYATREEKSRKEASDQPVEEVSRLSGKPSSNYLKLSGPLPVERDARHVFPLPLLLIMEL